MHTVPKRVSLKFIDLLDRLGDKLFYITLSPTIS